MIVDSCVHQREGRERIVAYFRALARVQGLRFGEDCSTVIPTGVSAGAWDSQVFVYAVYMY